MFNMWNCLHWQNRVNNWITDQRTLDNEKADGLYKHLESHKKSRLPTIKWKILHANIVIDGERKYVEAFEIQKHSGHLMNGCMGRIISV